MLLMGESTMVTLTVISLIASPLNYFEAVLEDKIKHDT